MGSAGAGAAALAALALATSAVAATVAVATPTRATGATIAKTKNKKGSAPPKASGESNVEASIVIKLTPPEESLPITNKINLFVPERFRDAGASLPHCEVATMQNKGTEACPKGSIIGIGKATIKLMDDLDLTKYFMFIAGGDTFPVHKPNPGHVTGVIEKLGLPAANCAMVGDSSNDVRAARRRVRALRSTRRARSLPEGRRR